MNKRVICLFLATFLLWVILLLSTLNNALKTANMGQKQDIENNNVIKGKEKHRNIANILVYCDSVGVYDCNDSLVMDALLFLEVENSDIVMAQMKVESGNYSSGLAKNNNNYFGMKHPTTRFNCSLKERNGYAYYQNWCYSILDYKLWQLRYANGLSSDEYINKLQKVYAEDTMYIHKIKKIIK